MCLKKHKNLLSITKKIYSIMIMNLYQLRKIETPHLIIRPVQLGDEYGLHESILRSATELRRWMPWARDTHFQTTKNFIHRNVELWQSQTSKDFPLTVIHKETKKIISVSGFNEHTDLIRPCFEIGYWMDSAYTRKGLTTELVNALTRYALDGLGAIRAQICTQVENKKSTAVAIRCGYVFEAMIRQICLDCTSKLSSDGLLHACCDTNLLPPLEVTWEQDSTIAVKTHDSETTLHQPIPNAVKLPTLQEKRICLRAPRLEDTDKLYAALMNSIDDISPWFSWAKKDLTKLELQQHIKEGINAGNDVLASEHLFFLVWDKYYENILGEVWIKVIDWAVPNLQISYWLDTKYVGQGYAFEAVSALIRYAFAKRNAKCIQLYISEKNVRSLKLADRLGFQHEGTLKNYFKNFSTNEISSAQLFSMSLFSQLKKNPIEQN